MRIKKKKKYFIKDGEIIKQGKEEAMKVMGKMGKSSSKICPAEDNVDQKTATNICIRRIGHSSVVFHALRIFFILFSVEYSNIS